MGQESIQSSNEEISLFALLLTLNQFKKWIIGIPLVVMIIAAIVLFFQPNKYKAELKMSSTENTVLLASVVDTPELYTQLEQRLKLMAYYQVSNLKMLALLLKNNIKVIETQNKILTVSVTDTEPKMAAKIANTYGEMIVDIAHARGITGAAKSLESIERTLLYTRQLLKKNAEQVKIAGVEKILRSLPLITCVAIDSIAGLQAEAALLSDIDELSTKDTLRIADIVSTVNQSIKPILAQNQIQDQAMYEAVILQQSQVFLTRIEQRLLKRIDDLKWEMTKDPQIIVKAEVPSTSSASYSRIKILLSTGIISLLLTISTVLVFTNFVRMKHEYMQSKKMF